MEYIENDILKVGVAYHGAELSSVIDKRTGKEMIWQADPKFWNRHAPILFPFVGNVRNGVYKYKGKEYSMTPHGFARDKDFELLEKKEDRISFVLRSTEETKKVYPFDFELVVTHVLEGGSLKVMWEVSNPSDDEMYYSIGGHPAFRCPIDEGYKRTDYKVKFDRSSLNCVLILQATREVDFENPITLHLKDGYLDITENLFDSDALIFDDNQVREVSLVTPEGRPYVTMNCEQFPSFGLWSNPSVDAEYICLEPWAGRCVNKGFDGELPEKYGVQKLDAHGTSNFSYLITFH
jgi:galactose mutarotase-like enzyme